MSFAMQSKHCIKRVSKSFLISCSTIVRKLDLDGPLFSLRGIDNRSYYWIREDGDYHNWTGCGNTLNLSHPAVVDYASACLRYWVETCHVDGFRFDLAAVMGRTPEFRQDAPLFTAIQNCPGALAGEVNC
ncbi:glycogen debranching protein [Escherichia coli]|nr:glycogen debranching protein [Escherichia coli]